MQDISYREYGPGKVAQYNNFAPKLRVAIDMPYIISSLLVQQRIGVNIETPADQDVWDSVIIFVNDLIRLASTVALDATYTELANDIKDLIYHNAISEHLESDEELIKILYNGCYEAITDIISSLSKANILASDKYISEMTPTYIILDVM